MHSCRATLISFSVSSCAIFALSLITNVSAAAGPIEDCFEAHDDHDRRIEGCNQFLESGQPESDANRAAAYFNRGFAFARKSDNDRAIADYTKSIELNPRRANVFLHRGHAERMKGELDRAIADYTSAIQIDPNNAKSFGNRGAAYGETGDARRAIEDFTKAIAIDPKYAVAYSNRGVAYTTQNDFDRAIADHNKAIELAPGNASFYANRGYAHRKQGHSALAIADLRKAIGLDPSLKGARADLASLEEAAAASSSSKAPARDDAPPASRAAAIEDQKTPDDATSVAASTTKADASNVWGVCMTEGSEPAAVIAACTKLIDDDKKYLDAYFSRAAAYAKIKDYDHAIADMDVVIDMRPDVAFNYRVRSDLYAAKGDAKHAQADREKADAVGR